MDTKRQEPTTHANERASFNQAYASVREALKVLPVSREAFYKKLKNGELPHFKFGRKILVNIEEVMEAMRAGK
jgi:excisionase family DNA binding protein